MSFIILTIECYLQNGFTPETTPYFISCGNSTIINSCTFLTGAGSGSYSFSSTYKTAKILKSNKGMITCNDIASSPTKQYSAFSIEGGTFTNNNIYEGGWVEPIMTQKTIIDTTKTVFDNNYASYGSLTNMFDISPTQYETMQVRSVVMGSSNKIRLTNFKYSGDHTVWISGVNNPSGCQSFVMSWRNNGSTVDYKAIGSTFVKAVADGKDIIISGMNGHSTYFFMGDRKSLSFDIILYS